MQDTALRSHGYDRTRVVDACVPWAVDKTTRWRLSLSDVVPRNDIVSNTIVGAGSRRR